MKGNFVLFKDFELGITQYCAILA